jgi:hypothetical protein
VTGTCHQAYYLYWLGWGLINFFCPDWLWTRFSWSLSPKLLDYRCEPPCPGRVSYSLLFYWLLLFKIFFNACIIFLVCLRILMKFYF